MKDLVQPGGEGRAEVARLRCLLADVALSHADGQHKQRQADEHHEGPDPVDVDGDADQEDQRDRVAPGTGDDGAPDVVDRGNVGLNALDQEARRVGLVKRGILPHQSLEQVEPELCRGFLRDPGQQDLLYHAGETPDAEDPQEHEADPAEGRGVAGHEDEVEHRLHHVADGADHAAFDQHEDDRDAQQSEVRLEVVAPEPAHQLDRGFGCTVRGRGLLEIGGGHGPAFGTRGQKSMRFRHLGSCAGLCKFGPGAVCGSPH